MDLLFGIFVQQKAYTQPKKKNVFFFLNTKLKRGGIKHYSAAVCLFVLGH